MGISFVCLVPVRLLRSSRANLCHVDFSLQKTHSVEMFYTSVKVKSEEKILQRIGLLPSFSEALKCEIKKTLYWKRAAFLKFLGYGA